jgi:THO complex subunit 5
VSVFFLSDDDVRVHGWDPMNSSIYQDIPLYSIDEFKSLAPPDIHTDEALSNEHQLMLNRLTFELAERQRLATFLSHELGLIILFRLDLKKKELIQQKEALLKESKVKAATMDSVKSQLDVLMKVRFHAYELVLGLHIG